METSTIKKALHKLIDQTDDLNVLKEIYEVLTKQSSGDWWDELSEQEQKAVEDGLKEAEEENFHEGEDVHQQIREKYKL